VRKSSVGRHGGLTAKDIEDPSYIDDSGAIFGRTDLAAIATKGFGLRGANVT
jgi:hypothetical protein